MGAVETASSVDCREGEGEGEGEGEAEEEGVGVTSTSESLDSSSSVSLFSAIIMPDTGKVEGTTSVSFNSFSRALLRSASVIATLFLRKKQLNEKK